MFAELRKAQPLSVSSVSYCSCR